MAGETNGSIELLLRSMLDTLSDIRRAHHRFEETDSRIERKIDRLAHHLTQIILSTPISTASSDPRDPKLKEFGLTIIGWLLERSWPSLIGHVLPLIAGAALLFWRHLNEWAMWVLLLLRSLGG